MSKTLLYRIFGTGKVPKKYLAQIQNEGVILQDEGVGGSITFRNFRSPGRRSGWRRNWFTGSIVLTREHLLGFAFSRQIIGVAWHTEEIRQLSLSVDDPDILCVEFDASKFNEEWSGEVEVKFRTPLASRLITEIKGRTR